MKAVVLSFLSLAVALGDLVEQSWEELDILQDTCSPEDDQLKTWSLSLRKYQNTSGPWADLTLTGDDWGAGNTASEESNMGVKATSFECDGRKMIRLEATFRDPSFFPNNTNEVDKPLGDRLRFHEITAENTHLSNHGFTAMKVDTVKHGVVFSHRPLKPNETFVVKIDQIVRAKEYANAMGVTTHSPHDIQLPNHMNVLKSGTWMLYHSQIWHDGSRLSGRYLRTSLDSLKVGDRLGVMRTSEGVLHFFINGADQGPAISGIPENVYGVYEFYGDTSQVTLVHSSCR